MIRKIKDAVSFYSADLKRTAHDTVTILRHTRQPSKNVAYMGWVGYNNLGDEILYDAHIALFPRLNMLPYRKNKLLDFWARVLGKPIYQAGCLGGGTLINQSNSWLHKIKQLQNQDSPIYCFGTGVTQPDFRAKHEKTDIHEWVSVLEGFQFVGVRGPYSLKMLNDAGFGGAQIIGDTALALARPSYKSRDTGRLVIGFNYGLVKENHIWGDADTYTENVATSIRHLIDLGYTVRLLPVWDKDLQSNRALAKRVNDPRCILVEDCYKSFSAYSAELDKCSLFIGQKLHATIMATMLRIPSIMIEYQPKCRDYMASVGMERWVIKTSDCTPQLLLKTIRQLTQHSESIEQELNRYITRYRTLQYKLAAEIEDMLLGK